MKLNKLHILAILFFVILFQSCQTTKIVNIQVIKPAKITVPSHVSNLIVVNNSAIQPTGKFKYDIQNHLFSFDTLLSQYLTSSVASLIDESPRFDSVILIPNIYYRKANNLLKPIAWKNVNSICNLYDANGLIAIEALSVDDTVVNYTYYDGYTYTLDKSLVLIVNSIWRLYDNENQKVIDKKIHRDTIAFNHFTTKNEYFNSLSNSKTRNQIANEIATSIAAKIADRISPYWLMEERQVFISGNNDLVTAGEYALSDDWIKAAKIWSNYTDNDNSRIAAAACYNMAVACEVQGKIDLALVWLEKSIAKYNYYFAAEYQSILLERTKETEILDKQFGVN